MFGPFFALWLCKRDTPGATNSDGIKGTDVMWCLNNTHEHHYDMNNNICHFVALQVWKHKTTILLSRFFANVWRWRRHLMKGVGRSHIKVWTMFLKLWLTVGAVDFKTISIISSTLSLTLSLRVMKPRISADIHNWKNKRIHELMWTAQHITD